MPVLHSPSPAASMAHGLHRLLHGCIDGAGWHDEARHDHMLVAPVGRELANAECKPVIAVANVFYMAQGRRVHVRYRYRLGEHFDSKHCTSPALVIQALRGVWRHISRAFANHNSQLPAYGTAGSTARGANGKRRVS